MIYALGIVTMVVALLASVGLHEWGHYITARKSGMNVKRFFIGMGPTAFSWTSKKTGIEYGAKWLPIGGFVDVAGMAKLTPREEGWKFDWRHPIRSTSFLVRSSETPEKVAESEAPNAFWKQTWGKRFVMSTAGPTVNIVLGVVLTMAGLMLLSRPSTLAESVACPETACAQVIEAGDRVVAVNGEAVSSPADIAPLLTEGDDTLTIERGGEVITAVLPEGRGINVTWGKDRRATFGEAAGELSTVAWGTVKAIVTIPGDLVEAVKDVATTGERAIDSPTGVVGISRISGEVAERNTLANTDKGVIFLILVGGLNLSLGIVNLVPLLPLDGGRSLLALIDGVRSGVARLRSRPRPEAVNEAALWPVTAGFLVVILTVFATTVVLDLFWPIQMFG